MSPYGDSDRAGERWDTERFSRESHQRRGPPVLERETRYEEVDRYARAPSVPGSNRGHDNPAGEFYVRRPVRYREEERVEFSDRRRPGRFFEDDPEDAYEREHRDRREERGQLVPFERTRETVVERRSGRTAAPRPGLVRRQSSLDTYDRKPLPRYRETEIVQKRRRSPPERFVERVQEEEVLVGDSEYYAEEEVRAYLERDTGGGRREVVEEREEREEVVESEFPKRGKTRMPMRLVNRRAVIELGYPFVEEGETLVILKALGKEHIDEVILRSREMNKAAKSEREVRKTTYMIESPGDIEEKIIERRTEIRDDDDSLGRDWGALTVPVAPRARSRLRAHSTSSTRREIILEDDRVESATIRGPLGMLAVPDGRRRESATIQGPVGVLVVADRHRRESANLGAEVRALEAERRLLRLERQNDRDRGLVRVNRYPREAEGELVIETVERRGDVVRIEKERKAGPNPKVMRAMLATLT